MPVTRIILLALYLLLCCLPCAAAPIIFTENRGQVADDKGRLRPDVLFTAQGAGMQIYISARRIYYQFERTIFPEGYVHHPTLVRDRAKQAQLERKITSEVHRFSISIEGASEHPVVRKEDEGHYTENFYLAHCPQGILRVPTCRKIVLQQVYPGIDWVVYSNGEGLKYDFIVHPGADPRQIRLRIEDADEAGISAEDGSLSMRTRLGALREEKPVSFSGDRKVGTVFRQLGPNVFGYALDKYDPAQTLIIDPGVRWGTYFGGSKQDYGNACAGWNGGVSYLAGYTESSGLASSGGFQTALAGFRDAFVAKFDSTGNRIWSTYYGGNNVTYGRSIATDGWGNVYLAGTTLSTTGFASAGAHQTAAGGHDDAFLVKFDSSGARRYATYYGGAGVDRGTGCAVDTAGHVFLTGTSHSSYTNMITPGAYQYAVSSAGDGFIAKFDTAGVRLWGTLYSDGGSGGVELNACATDPAGNIYIAGWLNANCDLNCNAHQTKYGGGGTDAFLTKFSGQGARLWATYYGHTREDGANSCSTDPFGNVYIAGFTNSASGIATAGAHQSSFSGSPINNDAFAVKFDSNGVRQWGTYLGTSYEDVAFSCAADATGCLIVGGNSNSLAGSAMSDTASFQPGYNAGYLFVNKLGPDGKRIWGSRHNGNGGPGYMDIHAAPDGAVYFCGMTAATTGISTPGVFQTSKAGTTDYDAYLTRIEDTSIITGPAPRLLCTGIPSLIPFSSNRPFAAGNVYTAELSDSTGSFAAPVAIGSLATHARSGFIPVIIPAGTYPDSTYRIRVNASSPYVKGVVPGTDTRIRATPAAPAISFSGGLLQSDTPDVQWYGPSGRIPGATGAQYLPIAAGDYYAIGNNGGCPSDTSNIVSVTPSMLRIPGVQATPPSIYPQPARDHAFIVLGSGAGGVLSLCDAWGKVHLKDVELRGGVNSIDLAGFAPGLYFVQVSWPDGSRYAGKIVVVR